MPTIKRLVSTDQPARYLALGAIIIACISSVVTFAASTTLSHRARRDEVRLCRSNEAVKALLLKRTKFVLDRVRITGPPAEIRATEREFNAERKTLAPHDC